MTQDQKENQQETDMIWVTRSEPGASRLAQALESRGHATWCRPVLEVAPLSVDAPGVAPQLVITLSGHAAREAIAQGHLDAAAAAVHVAIGETTARELEAAGVSVRVPAVSTSEGILAMAELAGLEANAPVWLWSGRGGRDLLEQELGKTANVVKFELYLRRALPLDDVPQSRINAVIVSSIEGLQAFHEAWHGAGGGYNVTVIAVSSRVAEHARELGYTRVFDSNGADTQSVCQAVDQHAAA